MAKTKKTKKQSVSKLKNREVIKLLIVGLFLVGFALIAQRLFFSSALQQPVKLRQYIAGPYRKAPYTFTSQAMTVTSRIAPQGYGACLTARSGTNGATVRVTHIADGKTKNTKVGTLKANEYKYFCTAASGVTGSSDRVNIRINIDSGNAQLHWVYVAPSKPSARTIN